MIIITISIYYEKEFNLYYARCCHGIMQDEKEYNIVYFPSPVETIISKDIADSLKKMVKIWLMSLRLLFADEACSFYKRYTGSNIKINKTAQTISSAKDMMLEKNNFIENYITMDWKNKLYIYKNQDGKDIVFDGK